MKLAVIIPLCEDHLPANWLRNCVPDASSVELVVCACAGLPSEVLEAARASAATVNESEAGRGSRLREAALRSDADAFVFLHADTRLPDGWRSEVESALSNGHSWGAFRLAFVDSEGRRCCRGIAWGARARSRLFGLPFGDQAPFVLRDAYESSGGHPDWPFLDDLELSKRLKKQQAPVLLKAEVESSARHYKKHGRLRSVLRNLQILLLHALGRSAESLAERYRR